MEKEAKVNKLSIRISGIDISQAIRPLIQSFFGNIEYSYAYVGSDETRYGTPAECDAAVYCDFTKDAALCSLWFFDSGLSECRLFGKESLDEMPEDISEYRYAAGRLVYSLLKKALGKDLPWGIMVGIRPTKHVYEAIDKGLDEKSIRKRFEGEFFVSKRRTDIALEIARREHELLSFFDPVKGLSIYIGIPFCPTTCLYCSFTSYPVARFGDRMGAYIKSLIKEMEYVSGAKKSRNIDTIYVGGGTPTALDDECLERLLAAIHKYFPVEKCREFCVEAGRPDSLSISKLRLLKKYGVTRISINPQTLNEKTLELIGRRHSVAQVYEAFEMARAEGHDNINLDMIVGLSGENAEDVKRTLEGVKVLSPESLTVHTLAIKRAARLRIENDRYKGLASKDTVLAMELAMDFAGENGYHPYYLYRQKNMAENLENIGYAKEGREGLYNILIMEEKQTILALGAGATTKLVYRPDADGSVRIERVENVKNLDDYITRVDEMIERKKKMLKDFD